LKRVLGLGAAACLPAAAGCSSVGGEHDTTFHFLVAPQSNGTFWGWTEIHLSTDINSVGTTVLWGVTLSVESPPEADLSFLSTLTGAAVVGETRTPVAKVDSFSVGEQTANMTILYFGDLHPLFKDSQTIRLEWSGATNPAFTAWPSGGIWIAGDVTINVE
jgi:hypothetical protein